MNELNAESGGGVAVQRLVRRLRDEADLCRNETATDVADLLDEAASEITRLNEILPGPEYHGWLRMMKETKERAAVIAERYPTRTNAGEDVADGIAAAIRGEEYEPDADTGRMEHDDCGDN